MRFGIEKAERDYDRTLPCNTPAQGGEVHHILGASIDWEDELHSTEILSLICIFLARISNGFCSFELAETLKSELVERDGSRMMWKGMAGETSRCSSSLRWPLIFLTLLLMSSRVISNKGAL